MGIIILLIFINLQENIFRIKEIINIISEVDINVSAPSMDNPDDKISKDVKNIIIGDSQVPWLDMNTSKASRLSQSGGKSSLWEGGKSVSWLISSLSEYPVSPEIANVVIVIGTNGGFGKYTQDNIPKLFESLRRTFPSARFFAVQGSYGWGSLKDITEDDVRNYYSKFRAQGATVIEPPIGKVEPHGNKPVYAQIGKTLDSLL